MAPSYLRERAHTQRASGTSTSQRRKKKLSLFLSPAPPALSLSSLFSFPPSQLFLKRPKQKAKTARSQETSKRDTCESHKNWQISDFLHTKYPLRSESKQCVPRKPIKKRHHSGPSTQQKKTLYQPPFQQKLPNHLLLRSHFPSRATTQRQVCSLIQVWCRGRKGKAEGGQQMAFSVVSLSSPGLGGRV